MKLTRIRKTIKESLIATGSKQTIKSILDDLKPIISGGRVPEAGIVQIVHRWRKQSLDPTTIIRGEFDVCINRMPEESLREYAQSLFNCVDQLQSEFRPQLKDLMEKNNSLSIKLADAIEERRVLQAERSCDESLLNRLEDHAEKFDGYFTKRTIMHQLAMKLIKDRKAMKKTEFKNKLKGTNNDRTKKR